MPSVPIEVPLEEYSANSYKPRYRAKPGYNSIKMTHPSVTRETISVRVKLAKSRSRQYVKPRQLLRIDNQQQQLVDNKTYRPT
jgi:hypothetical protein